MQVYGFEIDKLYSRKDVYRIIDIPVDTHGGVWDTGYFRHNDDYFIFTNIGVAGRTGHNYNNSFDGDLLHWVAKGGTHLHQPNIQRMLNAVGLVYVFYRTDSRKNFTYAGTAVPYSINDTSPVEITWKICGYYDDHFEINHPSDNLMEGGQKSIVSSKYERNPLVRSICLSHYGYRCVVCSFNFESMYGEIGKNYIHVHHIVPLSSIKESYVVNPVNDLRPICPNCHVMIHRKNPPISIDDLSDAIKKNDMTSM